MTKTDLLPCPFCGKQPEAMRVGEQSKGLMIECITNGCVNPGVSYMSPAVSKAKWNTRAAPKNTLTAAAQDLLDALEAILEDADHILHHTPHLGNDYFENARSAVAKAKGKEFAATQQRKP